MVPRGRSVWLPEGAAGCTCLLAAPGERLGARAPPAPPGHFPRRGRSARVPAGVWHQLACWAAGAGLPAHTHEVSVLKVSRVEQVDRIDFMSLVFLQKMRLVVKPPGDVTSNTISSPS